VPTLREQGVSMALREWYAIFMPGKASAETVQRAAAALRPVLADREVVEFARQFGLEVQGSAPRELADLLKKDSAEWGGLVKQTGFTAES
jgi:tripartite-type tricarboxylate transporter receptor subunit TctC